MSNQLQRTDYDDPYGSDSDDSDDLFSEQFQSDDDDDSSNGGSSYGGSSDIFTPPTLRNDGSFPDEAPGGGGGGGTRGAGGGGGPGASGGGGGGGGARRQHKYSTADMDDGTSKWSKILQIVCLFLLALAVMIGISIGMNRLFNSPELVPDAPEAANAQAEGALPKTRHFVDEVCAADKVSGSERIFCETACEPFHGCCDIFDSQNGTCYEDEVAGCYSYAKCHGLSGKIDPAPDNLNRVCNPHALNVDREQCENMCNTARCCWDNTVDSCIDEYYEACQDYSHCQNLRAGRALVPVANTDLDVQCKRDSPYCRRACNDARCCTDEFSDCYRSNFISCLSYTPCNTMNNTSVVINVPELHSSRLPPAPSDLRLFCVGNRFQENPEPCEFACEAARCCWASGPNNCFGFDPLGCLEYIKCQALYGDIAPIIEDEEQGAAEDASEVRFNRNREYVKNTCGEQELTNAEDRSLCTTACFGTFDCCNPFQQDRHGENGDPEINMCYKEEMGGCYTYAGCHALNSHFDPAPDTLHELCAWDVVLQSRTDCEEMCEEVRCCWDETVSPCYDTAYETCQDYAPCQNLREDASIRVAPPGLEVECLIEDNEVCDSACMHADDCCGDPFGECYRTNFIACLSYSVCPDPNVAMSNEIGSIHTILPQPSGILAEVCSPDYVNETGSISECQDMCEEARCCFEHNRDYCFGADPLGCLEYQHCRITYTYVPPPTSPPTSTPTASVSPTVEPTLPPVAVSSNGTFANATDAEAEALPVPPTPNPTPSPTTAAPTTLAPTPQFRQHRYQIQNICPSDEGACSTACEAAHFEECCDPFTATVTNSSGNCPSGFDPAGCYSYSRCHTTGEDGSQLVPGNNLARFCAMNALQLDFSTCYLECNNIGCCWDESEQSCLATHFNLCTDFSPCLNINQGIQGKTTFSGGTLLEVAPERLDQYCTPGASSSNTESCEESCFTANMCCSDVNSTCYRDNFVSCMSYSACNQRASYRNLFSATPVHSVIPPVDPDEIRSTCAPANPETLNATACEEICGPSECCWTNDINESCFGQDPFGCIQYKLCAWNRQAEATQL